jgi:hypothetical protein
MAIVFLENNHMHEEELYQRENARIYKEVRRETRVEQSEENIPERIRMNEVGELQKKCSSLDRDLLKIIERSSVERAIEKGRALETLAFGKVISERQLSKTGVNAITRNEYQGDPPRTAFVKPQSGEVNLVYDTKTKEGYRINKKKKEDGTFEEIRSVLPEKYAGGIRHFQETLVPQLKTDIAHYYGIVPQEVTVFDKGFSGRLGIEMGGSVQREYAVSRVDQLLGWESVPLTVLRSEADHSDISSVQEAVKGSGVDEPPRSLDVDLLQEVQKNGPDHPAAKSFMRLACIDYLVKSSDRHPENILYNPSEQKFYGIDNGRSMGLNAKPTGGKSKILDRYLSIPLSVTQEFPDWKLDAEAHKSVNE